MYERFTDRSRRVMQLAQQESHRLNHEYVGVEHIIVALAKEGCGVAACALRDCGIDVGFVRRQLEKAGQVAGPETVTKMDKLPLTPRAKKVTEMAIAEARNRNHNYVGTEHLLLAIVNLEDSSATEWLKEYAYAIKHAIDHLLGDENEPVEVACTFGDRALKLIAESMGDIEKAIKAGKLAEFKLEEVVGGREYKFTVKD